MTSPWSRLAALWLAVAERARPCLSRARASKTYGRAKRMAWEVLVTVVAATITTRLVPLLHGR